MQMFNTVSDDEVFTRLHHILKASELIMSRIKQQIPAFYIVTLKIRLINEQAPKMSLTRQFLIGSPSNEILPSAISLSR